MQFTQCIHSHNYGAQWKLRNLPIFCLVYSLETSHSVISGFVSHSSSLPFGQIGCNGSTEQTADSIWHLFRGIAVWRLSVEFFRLVPYLMSLSLVSLTFELKGMFLLVVRYQLLSVSLDWQMAVRLQIMYVTKWHYCTVMWWFTFTSLNLVSCGLTLPLCL